VWRLVLGKHASLAEIEQFWSLDDLLLANLALTVQEAAIAKQFADATKG
jgi:hypothetical protein